MNRHPAGGDDDDEWRDARAAGTVGDALTSAMATIGTAGRVLAALDDDTVARVNELADLERRRRDLLAQAETLDELAGQAADERAADLVARAEAARREAAEAAARAAELTEQVAAGAEARADAVRRAARAGLAEAAAEIDRRHRGDQGVRRRLRRRRRPRRRAARRCRPRRSSRSPSRSASRRRSGRSPPWPAG